MHQRKGTGTEAYPAVIDVDRDTSSAAQAGSPVDLTLCMLCYAFPAPLHICPTSRSQKLFFSAGQKGV